MLSWTAQDQQAGFPQLYKKLEALTTPQIVKEYTEGLRDCFSKMFGQNARILQNAYARELLRRGITALPNIFGDLPITDQW